MKRDWNLRVLLGTLNGFEGELASHDFFQRNIGERHARSRFDHRAVSQAELPHPFGDNVDQGLLVGDYLSGFLEKLCRHMAQGSDGVVRFRRELKDGPSTRCEAGWGELRGGEHKKRSVTVRAVEKLVNRFCWSG